MAEEVKLYKSTLLEKKFLEENKLGGATGVAEFENEVSSQGNESLVKDLAKFYLKK